MPENDVTLGLDGLDRVRRVALRSIPELLVGFDRDSVDQLKENARLEVLDFIESNQDTLADLTFDGLRDVVGMITSRIRGTDGSDSRNESGDSEPNEEMTDEEILARMEDENDAASDLADDLAAGRMLIVKSAEAVGQIANSAISVGLTAGLALL